MDLKTFQRVVDASSLLTKEQKRVLLEEPSALSDSYRNRIAEVLSVYEQGQKKRYEEIKEKLETIRAQFTNDMEELRIPKHIRDAYLQKMEETTSSLTSA